jgi:hypothetical protein
MHTYLDWHAELGEAATPADATVRHELASLRARDTETVRQIGEEILGKSACEVELLVKHVPLIDLTLFVSSSKSGLQAAVGISNQRRKIVVIFRSAKFTETGTRNFITDPKFSQISFGPCGCDAKVHSGVLDQLVTPADGVCKLSSSPQSAAGEMPRKRSCVSLDIALLNEIQRLALAYPDFQIDVTGHSIGAAVATLFMYELAPRLQETPLCLVTFGSPRVGNHCFRSQMESFPNLEMFRFHHYLDPVTRANCHVYRHVGRTIFIHDRAAVPSRLARMFARIPVLSSTAQLCDHDIGAYLRALQRW